MSVKGQIKETAGFVKEEAYERDKSPEGQKKVQKAATCGTRGVSRMGKRRKRRSPVPATSLSEVLP